MITTGVISEAYDDALRQACKAPDEGALIDSILKLRPIPHEMEEDLARLLAWATNRAAVDASYADSSNGD